MMKKQSGRARRIGMPILFFAAIFLLALGGCDKTEAFDEDIQATLTGAGITLTGNVNVTNACRFDKGKFDDSNCRFRETAE